MASSNLPSSRQQVKIFLRDTNTREVIPHRAIHLQPPMFELKIGRGSQTDEHLHPSPWNAWFTSRVMSREHAIVRADPLTRRVTIQDTGSMHGTYVDGARLAQDQVFLLHENDKIQLGAEIVRGDQTYKPLELILRVDWNSCVQSPIRPVPLLTSKNSFSPDYSSDDEGDDIELVYESIRIPSEDPTGQTRTFSVPDSDIEDVDVTAEIECACLNNSPPTSPDGVNEVEPKKDVSSSHTVGNEPHLKHCTTDSAEGVAGCTVQTALNLDDSEEELEDDIDEIASEDVEPISPTGYSSDEDQEFPDEDDDDDDDEVESRMSQLDEDPDEEEGEQALGDSQLSDSKMAKVQNSNEQYPRRPSPSDCALPKPTWYPTEHLPNIHSLVEQVPTPAMVFGDTYPTNTPPFPQYPPVAYCGGVTWSNAETNGSFSGSYDQGFNVPQLPSFGSAMPPYTRLCNLPAQELVATSNIQPDSASTVVKDNTGNKTSKVSINDIIEDVTLESASNSSRRKRKADEISTSPADFIMWSNCKAATTHIDVIDHELPTRMAQSLDDSVNDSTSTAEVLENIDAAPEMQTPSKKSVTFSPETVVIEANLDTERPQKRTKVHHDGRSSNLVKYVASAMAGAAVGVVGTVLGLAALPADYFT